MGLLASASLALCAFSAVFLTFDPTTHGVHPANQTAVRVIVAWTLIAAPAMLARRLLSKRPMPV